MKKLITKLITKLYKETYLGGILIYPIKKAYDFKLRLMPDDLYIKKIFKKRLGYELNLEYPVTLNEKIQWLKINDRTELHTICADKYAVRKYIKKKIGGQYLIPLLYSTVNPSDIISKNLPDEPFIIKTNHDSGSVTIVKNKSEIEWIKVQKELSLALKKNFYYLGREWQYKNIKPRIVVEKLLLTDENKIPDDYKIHCFNGKVAFIQVDTDRFESHRRNLYNPEWQLLDCEWLYKKGREVKKPNNLNKMKKLAEKLSEDFIYVRVDFYSLNDDIFFGELTFHTESGWGKFSSKEWDEKFGEMLKIK